MARHGPCPMPLLVARRIAKWLVSLMATLITPGPPAIRARRDTPQTARDPRPLKDSQAGFGAGSSLPGCLSWPGPHRRTQ